MTEINTAEAPLEHGSEAWQQERKRIMRMSRELEEAGEVRAAIDLLQREDARLRHPIMEHHLLRLRHKLSCLAIDAGQPEPEWPDFKQVDYPVLDGVATCAPEDLNADILRSAILGHGHLKVPGLLAPERAKHFRDLIDMALEQTALHVARESTVAMTRPWWDPIEADERFDLTADHRRFIRTSDSVWTADCPRPFTEFIDMLEDTDLIELISSYLGDRPEVSIKKCVLRRVPVRPLADWHQDGAFMGQGLQTVNLWLPLSDCGSQHPGLDFIPARVDDVLETGAEGAAFRWSISPNTIAERFPNGPALVKPEFAAGDALFFDEVMVHRTGFGEHLTGCRYAIESWFFAPGACPTEQIPLVV